MSTENPRPQRHSGELQGMSRHDRRAAQRMEPNLQAEEGILNKLDALRSQRLHVEKSYIEAFNTLGNIPAIVHRAKEPHIYKTFLLLQRQHDTLREANKLEETGKVSFPPGVLDPYLKEDIIAIKSNRVSIEEIGAMQKNPVTGELSPKDLGRINSFFTTIQTWCVSIPVIRDMVKIPTINRIQHQSLIFLASQALAQPDKVKHIPEEIKGLYSNMVTFFDYYAQELANRQLHPNDIINLAVNIVEGYPYLPTGVATFCPPRLGISPSSMVKLLQEREVLGGAYEKRLWHKINPLLISYAEQAYREFLPKDLRKYELYDEKNEKEAMQILGKYFAGRDDSPADQFKYRHEAKNLIGDFAKYFAKAHVDIKRGRNGRSVIIPSEELAQSVEVTSQYDQTLMFIIHLDDKTHLTIEIDEQGRVFGFPPHLLKQIPYSQNVIIANLLKPIVDQARPAIIVRPNQPAQGKIDNLAPLKTSQTTKPDGIVEKDEDLIEEKTQKAPKRKRLFMPITSVSNLEMTTPEKPPYSEKPVSYSEEEVRKKLGLKRSNQPGLVDDLLENIRRFEQGWEQSQVVKGTNGNLIKVRRGDFRIIFKKQEGGYVLKDIFDRKEGYADVFN